MKSFVLPPALLLVLQIGAVETATAGVTAKTAAVDGKHRTRPRRATLRGHHVVNSGQIGVASYYQHGRRVASGGPFNPAAMTAAHRTLPFGTRVRVRHLGTGRSVDVRINDRGPFIAGRIIDLSRGAAVVIGMTGSGLARVSMTVLGQ
jgi:rare lipoprotein A